MREARCGHMLSWWKGELETYCELPFDHDGDHFDGGIWWDDDMTDKSDAHAP